MNNNHRCPYCSRKVKYPTRLVERHKGEHKCSHCKKPSNITQTKGMWGLLTGCIIAATVIMLFYFFIGDSVNAAYANDGSMKALVILFFGESRIFKWLLWELVPFVIFFFASPKYMKFAPMKRYMEQTPSKIDLTVPNRAHKSGQGYRADGSTRIIPKADSSEYTGEFEDISSSSGKEDIDKTKNFNVFGRVAEESEYMNVTPQKTYKSESYSSDVPLKKINHEYRAEEEYVREAYEEEVQRVRPAPEREQKPGNYSGNRKF